MNSSHNWVEVAPGKYKKVEKQLAVPIVAPIVLAPILVPPESKKRVFLRFKIGDQVHPEF